ncbi:hypothetical protein Bca52824_035328 [Brassica carinata]|uniref:S1 motif domain-containing protein n=1 Tax=Brassica carinata TaxID=52824 RepID=A0A8X7S3G4_BRACI|nr:hypothetical protein Bca52824_035328 [Brassica carinata]
MEYYDPKPGEFVVGVEDLLFLDDDEDGDEVVKFSRQGMHVVEISTMIFAEVVGRTLSGRHHIKQLNEPTDVKIIECNIVGFLTRLEGLRGFIPKHKLTKRVNTSIELKEKTDCAEYVIE